MTYPVICQILTIATGQKADVGLASHDNSRNLQFNVSPICGRTSEKINFQTKPRTIPLKMFGKIRVVRKIWLPRILHVRIKANNNPSAFAITVTTNMFFSVYIKEFKNALSDKIFL